VCVQKYHTNSLLKVTESWRKLNNEVLWRGKCCKFNQITYSKIFVGYVICMGETKNMYELVVGKFERKRSGRPSNGWKDSIEMDLLKNCM